MIFFQFFFVLFCCDQKALQAAADWFDGFCNSAYWTVTVSQDTGLHLPCGEDCQKKTKKTVNINATVFGLFFWTNDKEIFSKIKRLNFNWPAQDKRVCSQNILAQAAFFLSRHCAQRVKPVFVCLVTWQRFILDPCVRRAIYGSAIVLRAWISILNPGGMGVGGVGGSHTTLPCSVFFHAFLILVIATESF